MTFYQYVSGNSLTIVVDTGVSISELPTILWSRTNITEFTLIGGMGGESLKELAELKHLTSLSLNHSHIGDKGAEALANGNLINLTSLALRANDITNKGVKELANGNLINLTSLALEHNNISDEGVKELVNLRNLTSLSLEHCSRLTLETQKALAESGKKVISGLMDGPARIFQRFVQEAWSENSNASRLDENITKKLFFKLARSGEDWVVLLLNDLDKYPFLINSRDEEGHTLSHFFTHSPRMQELLFKHGLVPEKEQEEQDNALQNVANGNQSTHDKVAVNQTNFITTKLVEDVKADKDELKQAATSYMENLSKLLKQYQDNQMKIRLLSLTENEKRSVMKKTLPKNGVVPGDKEFIEIVSNKVGKVLEQEYLTKNQGGEYITERSTIPLQYDYAREDAKVTIPESIGYIKLLIDRFPIPLIERKELLVTLANRNPKLVQQKLSKIREELGNNNIFQEQIGNKTEFHELLNNVDDKKVNKLFEEISGLNIEETWREQKEFVLLKQIYVAATTYGENGNACIQGTWSQIINSVSEIDLEMINQYTQHLNREKDQERQRDGITKENVIPFVEDLAGKLIQYVKDNPELKEVLQHHLLYLEHIDVDDPEKVTLEQQKILAKINREFIASIKESLPNYSRNIPKEDEYKIIINKLPEMKIMQDLVNSNTKQIEMQSADNGLSSNIQIKSNPTSSKTYAMSVGSMVTGAAIAYLTGAAALTPVVAVTVFIAAIAVGALVGYGIGKFCERVSEEKQNDPDMSTWTAVKSVLCGVFTTEHSKSQLRV